MFDLTPAQENWVNQTLAQMTPRQKLGQMVCENRRYLPAADKLPAYMEQYPIGHVFAGSEIIDPAADNIDDVRQKCDAFRSAASPTQHLLMCGDFEHGAGGTVSSLTRFPNPMALGATGDPQLAYAEGKAIALEAKSIGARWAYAPVADLNLNYHNPVTNHRAFGDDPDRVLPLLKAYIRGMQDHGFAACAKHFPGDGVDDRNQHQVTSLQTLSMAEWRRQHGRVFQELIDDGVLSIMVGHLGFPAYEQADSRGLFRPATASRKVMTELLRNELGFQGIIVTDALSMCGFASFAPYEERMIACFNGGADVFLWPETERFFATMERALVDGRASVERLEESTRRVLAFKAHLGIHEDNGPIPVSDEQIASNGVAARQVAERSLTLLRNRQDLVPLTVQPGDRVLLLKSEHAPDARLINADRFEPLYQAFQERGADVVVEPFTHFPRLQNDLDQYAYVLLLEHVTTTNSAGTIRGLGPIWKFMAHPYPRKVILSFGTPYYLHEVASADTYINTYCDCTATIEATARALFGQIPFRGTSPVACGYEFSRSDGIITDPSNQNQETNHEPASTH